MSHYRCHCQYAVLLVMMRAVHFDDAGSSRALALAAFASWLVTEALGAYMLRTLIISGNARRRGSRSDSMSVPVLAGHAGLAFSGFVCWVIFLATTSPVAAWLALGFLTPAIGLGISTVTAWTPYPAQRGREGPAADPDQRHDAIGTRPYVGIEAPSHVRPHGMHASTLSTQ